jgi:AmmeMemoRadiSam system protein B/AmmeMemoRadiSam system protein A
MKRLVSYNWILTILLLSACAAPKPAPTATVTVRLLSAPAASSTVPPGRIKPAEFAGSWYPGDRDELVRTVDALLAAAQPAAERGAPIALIVPHAGYPYSGPVAAYGFKQLEGKSYDVAVIIGADHQPPVSNPISVWAEGGFETPLGVVPVDVKLAQALIAADPRITFDPSTFQGEHMIEIELPFLQRTCPACSIVPILMGTDDEEAVQALAKALLPALAGRRAVVIASSDLSHYPKREDAVRVDNATLAAIETGDPARLRETTAAQMSAGIPNLVTCACSEGPILVAMHVAQGLGADRTTILHYANSADAPGGDPTQVVGYGAVMFWRYAPPDLTQLQRNELLKLARAAIAENLKTGRIPDYTTDDPALTVHSGAFVTLKENGKLRGCIGQMQADIPLYRLVQEMAVAAATSDPRFPRLRPDELSQVSIEVSVLSPLQRITDVQQIQVGTHGLMIVKDGRQGVFLPQVPIEQGWNRDEYLEELCGKAGLPSGCWRDLQQAMLYTFTAVVFRE